MMNLVDWSLLRFELSDSEWLMPECRGGKSDREARWTHMVECGKGARLGGVLSVEAGWDVFMGGRKELLERVMIKLKTREQGLGQAGGIGFETHRSEETSLAQEGCKLFFWDRQGGGTLIGRI